MTRQTVEARQAARVAGVLAVVLALGGCSDDKSVVHVDVTGQVDGIFQLVVDISAGGLATTLFVPAAPRAIMLPTSFNIEMDHSRQGELMVGITANDENGVAIARGTGDLPAIDVGHVNGMSIDLTPVTPSGGGQPDGGATPDDGGTSDDAGTADAGGDDAGPASDAVDDAAGDLAEAGDDAGDDAAGAEAGL